MDRDSGRPIEELLKLGKMGLELGYREQAEVYFDAVLARAPGHPGALLGKAKSCRDPQIALACVRTVLASRPASHEARLLEAEILARIAEPQPMAETQPIQLGRTVAPPSKPTPPRRKTHLRSEYWAALGLVIVLAVGLALWKGLVSRSQQVLSLTQPTLLPRINTPVVEPLSSAPTATTYLRQAEQATVLVIVPNRLSGDVARGSGTIIANDGLVLTNYHVVANAEQTALANKDGLAFIGLSQDVRQAPSEWYIAAVGVTDPVSDLAALRILYTAEGKPLETRDFATVILGDSDSLSLGEAVVGLGYPVLGGDTITSTRGSMAGFGANESGVRLGKTDSELLPGASGGAVLDDDGRLVGIIVATFADQRTQGRLSYFVLLDEALDLIARAKQTPYPQTKVAWMVETFQRATE